MNFLKSFAASQAADLERKRKIEQDMKAYHARVEQLIKENQELLAKQPKPEPPVYLDWDYEPSGIEGFTNGDLGT